MLVWLSWRDAVSQCACGTLIAKAGSNLQLRPGRACSTDGCKVKKYNII